jgi:hypothetical protein
MSHDLVAELTGYCNELARYEMHGVKERAAQVRKEITRVRGEISDRIKELKAEAADHQKAGNEGLAGQATDAIGPYAEALEDLDGKKAAAPKENTAQNKPQETAGGASK